jgi:hypothetical protein
MILSLVAIQIASPLRHPKRKPYPADFDHYLIWAHSNDPALVTRLRQAGFPAFLVAGMRFDRSSGAVATIPWSAGSYKLAVRASSLDHPHSHDNSFWYGVTERSRLASGSPAPTTIAARLPDRSARRPVRQRPGRRWPSCWVRLRPRPTSPSITCAFDPGL